MDGGGMYGVVDLGKEKAVEEEEEAGKGGEEDDKDRGEGDSLTITKPSHSLVPSSSSPFVRLPSSKPDRHTDRQALNVQSFASPHRGIAESVDSASAFSSSSSSAQRTSPSSRSTFRPRSKTTPRSRHARVEASLSELDDRKEGGRQEGLAARADSLESSEIKGIEQPEDEQAGFSEEDTPKVDLKGKGRAKRAASNSPERPPVNSSDAIAFPHSPPPSFSVENGSQPRRSNDFLAQNTSRPPSSSQSDDQTPSRSSRRRPPPITSELTPLPSELTPPPSPKSPYHAVRPSHNATTQVPNLQTSSRTRLSSNFPKSSTSSDVEPKQTTLSHSSGSQSTATPYHLDPIINKKTGSYVVLDEAKEVLFEATTKRAEGGKAGGGKKMIVDPDGGGLIYAVIIRDSNWIEQSEDKVEIRLRSECLRVERVLTAVYGEQKLAFVPFYIVGSARVGVSLLPVIVYFRLHFGFATEAYLLMLTCPASRPKRPTCLDGSRRQSSSTTLAISLRSSSSDGTLLDPNSIISRRSSTRSSSTTEPAPGRSRRRRSFTILSWRRPTGRRRPSPTTRQMSWLSESCSLKRGSSPSITRSWALLMDGSDKASSTHRALSPRLRTSSRCSTGPLSN
jgi:hypothetical protein